MLLLLLGTPVIYFSTQLSRLEAEVTVLESRITDQEELQPDRPEERRPQGDLSRVPFDSKQDAELSGTQLIAVITLIITSLGISIAAAIGIPIFISSAKIEEAAQEAIEGQLRDDIVENYKKAESTDAHLSRMIGILCYTHGWHLWSTGWLARSLKRYRRLHKELDNEKYAAFVRLNMHFLEKACVGTASSIRGNIRATSKEAAYKAISSDMKEPGEAFISRAERSIKDLVDVLAMQGNHSFSEAPSSLRTMTDHQSIDTIRTFCGWLIYICMHRRKSESVDGKWVFPPYLTTMALRKRFYRQHILQSADRDDSRGVINSLFERSFEDYRSDLADRMEQE